MKINLSVQDKVEAALNAAQAGCRERLLAYSDLESAAVAADQKLEALGIPKKYRTGCEVLLVPEAVPNSYKYPAGGTEARVRRFPSGWFLVGANRAYCRTCSGGGGRQDRLFLSPEAKLHTPDYYLV